MITVLEIYPIKCIPVTTRQPRPRCLLVRVSQNKNVELVQNIGVKSTYLPVVRIVTCSEHMSEEYLPTSRTYVLDW